MLAIAAGNPDTGPFGWHYFLGATGSVVAIGVLLLLLRAAQVVVTRWWRRHHRVARRRGRAQPAPMSQEGHAA